MIDRFHATSALLLGALALAACGGREQSADAPGATPQGIAVRGERDRHVAVVGGDTSAAPAPASAVAPTAANGDGSAPAAGSGSASAPAAAPARASTPASAGARPQDANEILRRVEQTAAGIRTMEADFTQTLRVPLLGTNRTSTGKLYQRKPDRFLMKFTDPAGDVMVADGRYFWLYYPSNDRTQVIRTSIAAGGEQADFQRQFLSNATSRFVATLNGDDVVDGRPAWALTLVPRRQSPYKVIRIWVDKADNLVRRFEMTEENESVRRVDLHGLRVNQPVSDALFTFTPPPGTHVFEQ
jgi:chaperone LolA